MISLILTSLLCASAPLSSFAVVASLGEASSTPAPTTQVAAPSYILGSEVVQTTREQYAEGSYRDFLNKMDKDYAAAKKESALEGLIEIRKEGARAQIHPEFARSYRVIQDLKNQQLLESVTGDDTSILSKKIHSATTAPKILDETLRSLSTKVPETGKNSDENALIDIDLEYYYKSIHLDSSKATERSAKHMALEMEKGDRMLKASQSFEDKALQKAVENHVLLLDEQLAKSYDMSDLNNLAKGKFKPVSPAEKEAAAAVSRAQGALADLHRHLLDSLDENGQTAQK
jgi:hypothetical protein